jgi:hypothetical protein
MSCDSQSGIWRGEVIGNDSVIVANQLRIHGWTITCHLLNPTENDVTMVQSILGTLAVQSVGRQKGGRTRSLCLEDEQGNRRWVFSRIPAPSQKLGKLCADITYVDYYPEFVNYLNKHLKQMKLKNKIVFVNLSAISSISTIPTLSIKPHIVQASISRDSSTDEAIELAKQVAQVTRAQNVFITMGSNGAVLSTGRFSWFSPAPHSMAKSILGAGAFFSAEVIAALQEGLVRDALLHQSVQRTSLRLESCYENHCT